MSPPYTQNNHYNNKNLTQRLMSVFNDRDVVDDIEKSIKTCKKSNFIYERVNCSDI